MRWPAQSTAQEGSIAVTEVQGLQKALIVAGIFEYRLLVDTSREAVIPFIGRELYLPVCHIPEVYQTTRCEASPRSAAIA